MDRSNHYEAAFEAYLQWHRLCYVAVDETRRAQLGDIKVKNLDFIVYGSSGARLLVDVKGRRFPTGSPGRERRVWECWSTQDDVDGLERWTELFGPGYVALLVFTYELSPEERASAYEDLRRLARAFDLLPPKCREAVWMRRVDDLPQKEVAIRLGITQKTVEKHVMKGMKLLAAAMFHSGQAEAAQDEAGDADKSNKQETQRGKP